MIISLSIQSLSSGLFSFQILDMVMNAIMTLHVYMFISSFKLKFLFSLGRCPGMELLGHITILFLIFIFDWSPSGLIPECSQGTLWGIGAQI